MQHLKVLNNGHPYIGFFFFILVSNALTSSLIDLGFSLQRNLLMIIMNTFISMEAYYDTVKQNSTEKGEIMHTQTQGSLLKTQGGFPQLKGSTCWKHIPSKYHPYMAASSKTHIHRFPCFWIPELAWRDPKNCSYWHTANDVRKNEVTPNTCAAAGVTEGRRRMGYSSPGIALKNPACWLEGFRQDLR